MRTIIFFLCLIIPSFAYGKTVNEFVINKSYNDVVKAIEKSIELPHAPVKIPNLPVILEGRDVLIDAHLRPSKRLYKVTIKLEKPIGKLWKINKTITVQGKPKHYLITSTIDIGYGRTHCIRIIDRIKASIIFRIENKILCLEEQKIKQYANKIPKQNVELKDYSWSWVFGITLEAIEVIAAKIAR